MTDTGDVLFPPAPADPAELQELGRMGPAGSLNVLLIQS